MRIANDICFREKHNLRISKKVSRQSLLFFLTETCDFFLVFLTAENYFLFSFFKKDIITFTQHLYRKFITYIPLTADAILRFLQRC